jgi:hypothetical protein
MKAGTTGLKIKIFKKDKYLSVTKGATSKVLHSHND